MQEVIHAVFGILFILIFSRIELILILANVLFSWWHFRIAHGTSALLELLGYYSQLLDCWMQEIWQYIE